MKRFLVLAMVVLGLAACQKDTEGFDVSVNGEVSTTVTVNLADATGTRAGGANSANSAIANGVVDGTNYTLRYILQVFDESGDTSKDMVVKYSKEQNVAFDVRLVPNRHYNFVAWADIVEVANGQTDGEYNDDYDLHYHVGENLKEVSLVANTWVAMDETRDAYTGVYSTKKEGQAYTATSSIDLTLTRPFAKLRVVTTDMKELMRNVQPTTAKVSYTTKHFNAFNALEGKVSGEQVVEHEYTIAQYTNEATNSKTLFTDYFFAQSAENVVKFDLEVYDAAGTLMRETKFNTDIPVKRNYLTTISGNVLTDGNNINVKIEDSFTQPAIDEIVWDGKSVKEPAQDVDGNYIIYEGAELAWVADQVNGVTRAAANTFKGKTIKLMKDINLNNEPWTPIGNATTSFQGTFDGNGKTIANLVVNGYNSNAGLFGVTTDGEIKNVIIENAKVSGRLYVGVVAGTPYTSKYTDITVQGHIEVNGMSYVGGVGGKNAYANWTNITIDADETSYVKANSIENGTAYRTYVGGVVGFNGEGGHKFSNINSNINVIGSTCDVGGLFGIAHYSNKFENCVCTGDVEIYAAEEAAEAEEIGGIAGVWHNQNDTTVTMTNVEFTGSVTTNITRETEWYNNLVGKPYSATGTGKLYLNGYEMVANGVGVNEDEYCVFNAEGLQTLAEMVENENEDEVNILLGGDINLSDLVLNGARTSNSASVASNWTPIGTYEKPFTGTFDGRGYTIKNLKLVEQVAKEGKAYIGFFGYAKDATIKNVTFENVYINIPCLDIDHSQGHIGAVAGSLEGTSTIEDVTVKGDIKVYATQDANGASRVAVVAGGNSYGNVTMKEVHVIANEGSYLVANNNTGALAGQLQGKSVFENCSSNIDVTVNKFFAGGIIGLAAGDQLFTNCHTTGDVKVVAGREGRAHDQYRVGGIAGGWADGATKVCTLVNCSYTGNISGKNSDGSVANPLDYLGFVGRGYTLNGCQGSKVVIDGTEFVQKYNTAAQAGIYDITNFEISNKTELFWFAQMVNSNKCTFFGQTVKLTADIDLNNEEWTPIGSAYADHGFMGNFDGNGKTIKNLTIKNITPDSDGYVYGGLFGVTEGIDPDNQNYIKDLVIENVDIDLEGDIVAAAIAYPYYTNIENVTVKGNVSIKGGHYTAGVLAYTRRCVDATNIAIAANVGSVIEGNQAVGGVISDIQMNGGLKAKYSNFEASGLTINGNMNVGGISGIISGQTLKGATVTNVTIDCDDARKGIVSGSFGDNSSEIANATYSNVVGAQNIVGAPYEVKDDGNYSMTINGVTYEYNNGWFVDGDQVFVDGALLKKDGIYYISNKAGMFWFANEVNVNKNAFSGKTVKLTANIDLNNEAWTPVGQTGATTFNGVFDGQNYTISNLNVNSEAQTGKHYSSGLFGWVESHTAGHGHIKNVKINGATIVGHHNCGALAGYITQETALVENCHVTGATVTCTKANNDADGDKAGALIGNATVATPVKDCTAADSTVSAGRDAGQVIGAGREANVTGCSATNVTVSANGTGTGANVRNEVIGRLL